MSIIRVGIDLAKNVFAVHGVDERGKPLLVKPKVARGQLLELIDNRGQTTVLFEQYLSPPPNTAQ